MSEPSTTNPDPKVPEHIAIIMDGNNRWAKKRGKGASSGHRAGVETVRRVLGMCLDHGVKVVTLFAFSSENWQRPSAEVEALMSLFSTYLKKEIKQLHSDGVRVRFIGDRRRFGKGLLKQMDYAEELTLHNDRATLVIAVDYGGQWDIANAARRLAEKVKAGELQPDDIDEQCLDAEIALADLPRPDLCIRTAGEHRISNFLLWQLAYSELFFTETLWPDFAEADFEQAMESYNQRVRRFGGREDDAALPSQLAGGG